MKLPISRLGASGPAGYDGGNVTLRIPASEWQLKTSNLHISLARHGYISDDATATERDDTI
jgi:hypothetical protein